MLLSYYGDDFTGSTDALEFLTRAGIKTALFLEPPTPDQLAAHPGIEAIGVACQHLSLVFWTASGKCLRHRSPFAMSNGRTTEQIMMSFTLVGRLEAPLKSKS